MEVQTKRAVKTVSIITVILLAAKALGMVRDIIFANLYGTSIYSDAFLSASKIPLLFFDLTLGVAVLSTFIPVFSRNLQTNKKNAFNFANTFLNIILIISSTFCLFGIIFAKQLIGLYGFDAKGAELATKLLIIMLPTAVFTAVAYVFVGILQSLDEFTIPACISLVSSGSVIIYLLFLNRYFGIYGLAVAFLIGWGLQILIQVPSLIKKGYRYRLHLNIREEGLFDVFRLALPILISSWVQPICVMINSIFASYLGEGSIAALDYANRLYIILVGVFTFAITNYIFPSLSRMSGADDNEGFCKTIKISVLAMLVLIVPIAVGMSLYAEQIISIVYLRGEFDYNSVILTASALSYFSLGMVGLGVNEILNKGFYAMKDGKTPMYASIIGIAINIILAFILFKYTPMGVSGLALAASISSAVIAIILIGCMQKKMKFIDENMLLITVKILASSFVMGLFTYWVKDAVNSFDNIYIEFGVIILSGALVYAILLLLFGVVKALKRES